MITFEQSCRRPFCVKRWSTLQLTSPATMTQSQPSYEIMNFCYLIMEIQLSWHPNNEMIQNTFLSATTQCFIKIYKQMNTIFI